MGITRYDTLIHWNYFVSIEEDLYALQRFVDFSGSNDNTFSIEIARILMASSAEIDVVLKQLCVIISPTSTASNINSYFDIVTDKIANFKTFEVLVPSAGLQLQPWSSWDSNRPPLWWTANNKVKHHRHDHFADATLKNCLNSVAALYISVLHLYHAQAKAGELLQLPKLFNVGNEHFGGTMMGRFGNSFKYKIDL